MKIDEAKVGFIGFGNMGKAICDGLLRKEAVKPSNIYACARDWDKLSRNCSDRGINACRDAAEVAELSDIVVIAVLPEQVKDVVTGAADALRGKPIFSVANRNGYTEYVSYLGEGYHHISTIPNTPIAIGEGIIIAENIHSLTDEQLELFEGIFGQIAKIEYLDPKLLTLGGAGAGSAPAFVDVFIEALADGLVKHGMTRAQAYSIVPQMMIGTARYFAESGMHPGALKDEVCSPGGTTIIGVGTLEEYGFRSAVIKAIDDIMAAM